MITAAQKAHIRAIHPFPARMAPSIVWDTLAESGESLKVLDPMSGSGTTLVCARTKGHRAIGCDTDPLARLIARSWCADVDQVSLVCRAKLVLQRAKTLFSRLPLPESYPNNSDDETCKFIDFWFDERNRRELNALATCISRVRSTIERTLLWCAFSKIIIAKTEGASLAIDVSHSRPRKVYDVAPLKPFDVFLKSVSSIVRSCPFPSNSNTLPEVDIRNGDARALPIKSKSIDLVITSPPYLNAIDYLRGHKLSLVWMGYKISQIRSIRSINIGTEVSKNSISNDILLDAMSAMAKLESLDNRRLGMIRRYVWDMNLAIKECCRVLKLRGRAVFVIGDSTVRSVFIKNSEALIRLAHANGLSLVSHNTRPIETKRRYLPPPESAKAGEKMQSRMRAEVILKFRLN